jgi:predicted metalloprotease
MEFDDQNVDASQLDDRRGMSPGMRMGAGAGGLGIVGVLVVLLVSMLGGGGDATDVLNQIVAPGTAATGQGGNGSGDAATRCNTAGAIDSYEDCYVLKIFNEVNEVWTEQLPRYGTQYTDPTLTFFEQAVSTGCGTASSQTGPFYCPPDRHVYVDLGFLDQLLQQFGASGRYAEAYVVAHEVGHHLQTLLGIESQVRELQQEHPRQANALSVKMELQADCFAGAWGSLANSTGHVRISQAEYQQALTAAAAVGDDRIQQQTTGRVDPESFTHGTSAQRQQWFSTGYRSADLSTCDTFKS